MTGAILVVLVVLVLALLAIAIVYALGIRSESTTVRKAARRFHHGVGNPLQLRSAGHAGELRLGAPASGSEDEPDLPDPGCEQR